MYCVHVLMLHTTRELYWVWLRLRAASPSRLFNPRKRRTAIRFVIFVIEVYYELALLPVNGFIKENQPAVLLSN